MGASRETRELKRKPTTAPNKMDNQIMMLQLLESLSPVHPSGLCLDQEALGAHDGGFAG
jgi:hypothetical protein